jgi:hypothetical protein
MTVPTATSFVNPSPWNKHGSGWRGRPLVSTSTGIEPLNFLGSAGGQVADPMIEADLALAQGAYREASALGCAPPARPGQGKTPNDRFIFVEQNDLPSTGPIL